MIVDFWLCLVGFVLVVGGCLGPWVPHETAALTVTGLELARLARDAFPHITREFFYFPFVAASVLLGLLAGQSAGRAVRLIAPLGAATVLLGTLLPFSVVEAARHALTSPAPFVLPPNSRGQLILVVVGAALTLLAPLAHRLPRRPWGILIALLALVGSVPALYQFALLRPHIVALYDAPVGLGWGLVACVAGFALLLLSGVRAVASPDRSG